MDFEVEVGRAGDRTVVAVRGDLDVLTAPALRDRLNKVIDGGALAVLVDLSTCEFIDSSGISALVAALKRVQGAGGELGLVCPAGNVRRLIELVALDQVFTIHDDVGAVGA